MSIWEVRGNLSLSLCLYAIQSSWRKSLDIAHLTQKHLDVLDICYGCKNGCFGVNRDRIVAV